MDRFPGCGFRASEPSVTTGIPLPVNRTGTQSEKRVVLPEGDEPRTIKAAAICAERGLATCVLLGDPEEIRRVAAAQGVTLGTGIELVNPADIRELYVPRLVELRKTKA